MIRFLRFACVTLIGVAGAGEARYFGLTPPDAPQPFEPSAWMSEGRTLTQVALAPGLGHAAFSVMDVEGGGKVAAVIHESRLERGEWSRPSRVLAFGANLPAGEGAFSPDGRWFFFSSDRSPGGQGRPRAFRAPVRNGSFGPPEYLELEIPEGAGVYYPRLLKDAALSFTSRGSRGDDELFIAPAERGRLGKPELMSGDFNSPKDDWDLVESRDGRLRIWVSAREGSLGKTDLYFSRRLRNAWSPSRNLAGANTAALETAPALSPDGRVLFFLRRFDGRDRLLWVRLSAILENS